jgi:anti-sigma B factor antagonist
VSTATIRRVDEGADLRVAMVAGDVLSLSVEGEIDLETAPQFAQHLQAAREKAESKALPLSVDLSGVGFIDSSGLRALLELQESCDGAAVVLSLRKPSPAVIRLLEVAGVAQAFPIE